jgi:hypothetical protein
MGDVAHHPSASTNGTSAGGATDAATAAAEPIKYFPENGALNSAAMLNPTNQCLVNVATVVEANRRGFVKTVPRMSLTIVWVVVGLTSGMVLLFFGLYVLAGFTRRRRSRVNLRNLAEASRAFQRDEPASARRSSFASLSRDDSTIFDLQTPRSSFSSDAYSTDTFALPAPAAGPVGNPLLAPSARPPHPLLSRQSFH